MNRLKYVLLTGVAAGSLLFGASSFATETREPSQSPMIARTYTQYAKEQAPVVLCGTEKDKEQLWDFYQKLGQTKEGRRVQAALQEAYERTGLRVPLRFAHFGVEYGALYEGPLAGVKLNRNNHAVDEIALGHELTHDVQAKREITESTIRFGNLKDAFIAGKLMELETKVQDTVMADEKNLSVEESNLFVGFLPLYRDFKKQGQKKFGSDEAQVQRYAKTQLARVLWEDSSMPLYQIPLNLFSRNEMGKAYEAIGNWNLAYDIQSARNLRGNGSDMVFQKGLTDQADALFNQFADKMGVDLDAAYFREKMDDGWGISVSNDKIKMPGIVLRLSENEHGGQTFSIEEDGTRISENIFDATGKCLSSKIGGWEGRPLRKEGNVALGLDEIHYDATGRKTKEKTCAGVTTTYYANQQVHTKLDATGRVLAYFAPDGKPLASEEEYQNGKNGVFYDYDQSGTLNRRTSYRGGKKNGPEICGTDFCHYKDNQKHGLEHRERKTFGGTIVEEITWENGYKHGNVYRNGKLDGYYHQNRLYWSREEYDISTRQETIKKSEPRVSASAVGLKNLRTSR